MPSPARNQQRHTPSNRAKERSHVARVLPVCPGTNLPRLSNPAVPPSIYDGIAKIPVTQSVTTEFTRNTDRSGQGTRRSTNGDRKRSGLGGASTVTTALSISIFGPVRLHGGTSAESPGVNVRFFAATGRVLARFEGVPPLRPRIKFKRHVGAQRSNEALHLLTGWLYDPGKNLRFLLLRVAPHGHHVAQKPHPPTKTLNVALAESRRRNRHAGDGMNLGRVASSAIHRWPRPFARHSKSTHRASTFTYIPRCPRHQDGDLQGIKGEMNRENSKPGQSL